MPLPSLPLQFTSFNLLHSLSDSLVRLYIYSSLAITLLIVFFNLQLIIKSWLIHFVPPRPPSLSLPHTPCLTHSISLSLSISFSIYLSLSLSFTVSSHCLSFPTFLFSLCLFLFLFLFLSWLSLILFPSLLSFNFKSKHKRKVGRE